MTLEISTNRRNEIKECVYNTLVLYGIPSLPVKIGSIIRNIKYIKLITYSSQIKKHDITYEELILNAETKDSYAVWNSVIDRYCIYYNDIEPNIVNSNRVRWNLAHELGHIMLRHHEKAGIEKLYRKGLDDATYKQLENEADYFAQLILVPHVVLYAFRVRNSNDIRYLCKISDPASKRRYYAYKKWSLHVDPNDQFDKRIFYYYFDFIYKKECKTCGAGFIQRYGRHCPICGSTSLRWGDGEMFYPMLDTYDGKKLRICPICENEETYFEGDYCQICGNSLVNYCRNFNCTHVDPLPSNARYCPFCGEESSFYTTGILKRWDEPNIDDIFDPELPFN